MRTLILVPLLALAACGGAEKNTAPTETVAVFGPSHLGLEGRALHEAACDHALDIMGPASEAMEGGSMAELLGECLDDLAETSPAEVRAKALCYLEAADIMQLAACAEAPLSVAEVPGQRPRSADVDPLTWRVCVHLADVAMAELSGQMAGISVDEVKDLAVEACTDALRDVGKRELEMVSDCLLRAKTVDEMQGCNLPQE